MCWVCKTAVLREVPKGEKFPVYKIMTLRKGFIFNELLSYYKVFKYKLHSLFTSKLESPSYWANSGMYTIDEGIHSYSMENDTICEENLIIILNNNSRVISYPIHPIASKKYVNVKVLGYIPEGGKYYINKEGECVSDKIILTKIIKL